MTTVYSAYITHMSSAPLRPELRATFATAAEREDFLTQTRSLGWRAVSVSDLELDSVANALDQVMQKMQEYAPPAEPAI